MKLISTLLNISCIIFSVNGIALSKRNESIPSDPNIYLSVFNPAVDIETPTWSNKKAHTIKYNSWLNNPKYDTPDYDIDTLSVVANKANKEVEICNNVKLGYGELNCELKENVLDNGLWEISIFPNNKKSWVMNKFNLIITQDGSDSAEEFLIPTTSHFIGNGIPFYITSPINDGKPSQIKANEKIEIKWKAFKINGYNQLKENSSTTVTVKVANYQPPIRYTENKLEWVTVCENTDVSLKETSCKIDASKDLKNVSGYYWVRIYEGKEAVAQTYIQLIDSDLKKIATTDTEINDGVMLHIIYPSIDNDGNFENWNIHSNEKKEVKWKVISGNKSTEVDVYAALLDEDGSVKEKHRICSEIEISAESCAFAINKFTVGVWKLYIENIKNKNVYEKNFVKISTSGGSKSSSQSSNTNENKNESGEIHEVQYIAGERSPYTIMLKNIESKWDIKKDIELNWIPTSANSYSIDYPKLSVFAQKGNKNITLCENIEIADNTCTVKADTIQSNGKWLIVWMKDGLIINEKTISTLNSDGTSSGNTDGRMLMENLNDSQNKFYVSYNNISNDGYAQWKKDSTQKISGMSKDIPNATITKASDEVDEVYNVVCDYKDNEECIFKLPDGVKRGEINSHWIIETVSKNGVVVSRLPIRLIE